MDFNIFMNLRIIIIFSEEESHVISLSHNLFKIKVPLIYLLIKPREGDSVLLKYLSGFHPKKEELLSLP